MDTVFWVGIGIGALLSFLASLAASYFAPEFGGLVDKSRFWWFEGSRRRATKHFEQVRYFREKIDEQTVAFIFSAMWVNLIATLSTSLVLLAIISNIPLHIETGAKILGVLGLLYVIWAIFEIRWLRR